MYLLPVGVNAPLGCPNPLQFAEADAGRVERAFTSSLGVVAPGCSHPSLLGAGASIAAIRQAIASVSTVSRRIIVYLNGHGSPMPAAGFNAYNGTYPYALMARDLRGFDLAVLILNLCHSGAAARAFGVGGVFGGDEPIARLACAELIEEACPGIRLFAASSAGDVTYQDRGCPIGC
jgi:hypothetical protein